MLSEDKFTKPPGSCPTILDCRVFLGEKRATGVTTANFGGYVNLRNLIFFNLFILQLYNGITLFIALIFQRKKTGAKRMTFKVMD